LSQGFARGKVEFAFGFFTAVAGQAVFLENVADTLLEHLEAGRHLPGMIDGDGGWFLRGTSRP